MLASSSGCDLRVYSFCPFNPAPVRGSQRVPATSCVFSGVDFEFFFLNTERSVGFR